MKVPVEIDIDETKHVIVCKREDIERLSAAIQALHGRIWIEACYDPYNKQTEDMARELLPHLDVVKECLKLPRR